jgi:calcium binding protein 39
LAADLPLRLVAGLARLDFEVRKDVLSVFSAIVRLGLGPKAADADQQLQEYAASHPGFFGQLVDGYERPEVATHCGMLLRSCARSRRLAQAFLGQAGLVLRLLYFTQHDSFDISSDAISTLRDLLLTHKGDAAEFLEANFQEFFKAYNTLIEKENYVTQRQALKLLSEMLLDRTFMRVMLLYIGNEQFLQIHMNLLRASSKAMQFETFHVFKIFVANPQKPPRVQKILFKNRDKLVNLLETIRPSRPDDRQFAEDRSTVIRKLQELEASPSPVAAPH